jgi:hypothetical protein
LDDITAVNTDNNGGLEISAHDLDSRALDMFDAFIGTLRARVKKIREAITKHYGVDIGDPTRTGRRAIDNLLRDIVVPMNLPCCADGCVAFTSRLQAASDCLSCRKHQYS